jgi:hypothetical protein
MLRREDGCHLLAIFQEHIQKMFFAYSGCMVAKKSHPLPGEHRQIFLRSGIPGNNRSADSQGIMAYQETYDSKQQKQAMFFLNEHIPSS